MTGEINYLISYFSFPAHTTSATAMTTNQRPREGRWSIEREGQRPRASSSRPPGAPTTKRCHTRDEVSIPVHDVKTPATLESSSVSSSIFFPAARSSLGILICNGVLSCHELSAVHHRRCGRLVICIFSLLRVLSFRSYIYACTFIHVVTADDEAMLIKMAARHAVAEPSVGQGGQCPPPPCYAPVSEDIVP